jgi:NAD(P)-dependent dehydrogenase (short-subunit alcohol dehydrogenase family)
VRVVLVTGGTRGVGLGIVRAFAKAGAHVVTCGRSEVDSCEGQYVRADVRDPAQVDTLISGIVAEHGRLDVVVNNAGGAPPAPAATASPRLHQKIIELNLVAPLHVAQRANAVMQQQDSGGSIVMIGSVSGTRPSPGTAAYGAAKAGLANLATSLAVEWAPKVRVNTVVVGPVDTELSHLHYGDSAGVAAVGETIPMGRMATPADVAEACLYLSSPAAAYVTGSTLTVHGGGERPAFLDASNAEVK